MTTGQSPFAVENLLTIDTFQTGGVAIYDTLSGGKTQITLREMSLDDLRADIVYKVQALALFTGRPVDPHCNAFHTDFGAHDLIPGGFIVHTGMKFDGGHLPVYESDHAPKGLVFGVAEKEFFGVIAQDADNPLLRAVFIFNENGIACTTV